jgi:hypothetical protein
MKIDNQKNLEETFAENLIKMSQDFYSNEENFDKSRCFSKNFIAEIINSGNLPDENILNHLFDCADCFQNYRSELSKHKEKSTQKESFVFFATFFRWQFAAFLLVGICLLSLVCFYYPKHEETKEIAQVQTKNENLPNTNQVEIQSKNTNSSEPNLKNEPKEILKIQPKNKEKLEKSLPKAVKKEQTQIKEKKTEKEIETIGKDSSENFDLELNENSVLRSDNYFNQNNGYKLPAKKVNLQLKLPNFYAGGNYKIQLMDAKTKILLSNNSKLQNYKISIKNVDLRKYKNKATRICLQKNGEIPDCFNIQIQ